MKVYPVSQLLPEPDIASIDGKSGEDAVWAYLDAYYGGRKFPKRIPPREAESPMRPYFLMMGENGFEV